MTKPLHGKVILITGGSAGIGKATALRFGKAGASVVIAARGSDRGESTLQEIRATGADAIFVQTDVSQSGQVQALLARTVERFGRLDCAFNNAAVLNRSARTGDYDQADFDTEVASNLRSVWLCMKYELEQMQKQQPCGGAIVNTSSINGLGGVRNAALYAMSKAGILALTNPLLRSTLRTVFG
jgi:NAD(P)-dependent dehydrogenase (short-subunit alcohol dehydrogenase family)